MTLGEMLILVNVQAGGQASAQENKLALGWALDAFAAKAAEAAGPRGRYSFLMDLVKDQSAYPLPEAVRTVAMVVNDSVDPPVPYSLISRHAEAFIQSRVPMSQYGGSGSMGYWIDHRTLYILPKPNTTEPGKLRVIAYGRAPIPRLEEETIAIPFEAERWVIAKAAALRIPPPSADALKSLGSQLAMAEVDLREWLWNHSADVPPGPMEDGLLE